MKILQIRTIAGPNVYHHKPILVMTLDLEDLAEVCSADLPGFPERMKALLPGMIEHRCSPGHRGGFFERLDRGTYFGHIVEHVALALSELAGIPVGYGKTVYGGAPGIYQVRIRFENEAAMKFLLGEAVKLAEALARGAETYDIAEAITEAKRIIRRTKLGPSTQAIVSAAEEKNIPWARLNTDSLIQFGYGIHRKLIQATTTSETGDIAVDIAQDKNLTKSLLEEGSIAVPRGTCVATEEEALAAFARLGGPVVVKPFDGNHGNGVSLGIQSTEEAAKASQIARGFSREVLVEEQFIGSDYRVLVIGGKMVAASHRVPAHVIGNGKDSIRTLIDRANEEPRRGDGHENIMTRIVLDETSLLSLERRGISLDQVPAPRETVILRETANLSTGGIAIDVTDEVHPQIRSLCERAARIVGLDICGLDLIAQDITKSLEGQTGGIIEVNAGPGIRMHHYPAAGKPRNVARAIVDMMYPGEANGRIPIVAITGTNGKTTVTRMMSHIVHKAGTRVGFTTSDGIYFGNEKIASGDTTGPASAHVILRDPSVEFAVLETARGGNVKRGLGHDWSDVGVLTNIQADHIGQDGIETIEDILHIKAVVAERVREGGILVLNADDPLLARLPERPSVQKLKREIIFVAKDPDQIVVRRHLAQGGTAFYVRDGFITENRGGEETEIAHVAEIPLTMGGTAGYQIANALSVAAACRASGFSPETIRQGLASFSPNQNNSGRANTYKVGRGYAMVDYGHNPEAFRAICETAALWTCCKVTGLVALPGDRSDEMIRMSARVAARGFDKIIIKEDHDLRGRGPGEVAKIVQEEIAKENPLVPCEIELKEEAAIQKAFAEMEPNEIIVCFYDDLGAVQASLKNLGAESIDTLPFLLEQPADNVREVS